ncbi:MAG: 2-iminobutanoate/2-iminopropanoate deaminase, partial [Algoriphagus sp.]
MHQIINSQNAPAPIGPYSQATLAGNTLYISGQIPIDPSTGNIISGTIEEETHMVMKNLQAILKEVGVNFSNIVKCSIFVKDMNDFAKIN